VSDYLTVQEVADLARREHKAVRRAIKAGRLAACRPDGGRWLIREADARAWIEHRPAAAERVPAKPRRVRPRRSQSADARNSVAYLKHLEREAS
jgi:excisionase family DNA binding protein